MKVCRLLHQYLSRKFEVRDILSTLPWLHVKANCMALPPTPQKASTMMSHLHLSAMCSAIFSGVTENHPSTTNNVFYSMLNITILLGFILCVCLIIEHYTELSIEKNIF